MVYPDSKVNPVVSQAPVVEQLPVNNKNLTHKCGFDGSPSNRSDNAFEKTSSSGLWSSCTTVVVVQLCDIVIAEDGYNV